MLNEKILYGIEPYNELFYRSCFYNSFFPVVKYFHKSILHFLLNDVSVYHYDAGEKPWVCSIRYMAGKGMGSLLKDAGIGAVAEKSVSRLLLDLKKAISDERPVILWVDSFYEPIRPEVYHKEHLPHTLLVYGFSEPQQEFYIVEHERQDSLTYEKRKISYSDLYNSYTGYIDYYQEELGFPAYNEYFPVRPAKGGTHGKEDVQAHLYHFKQNMLENEGKYLEGLEHLNAFKKYFGTFALDEAGIISHIPDMVSGFNDIVNAKAAHMHILQMLFSGNPGIINAFQKVLDNWNFIRATVVRYMYSKVFKKSLFEGAAGKLDELYALEHSYKELLYSAFKD